MHSVLWLASSYQRPILNFLSPLKPALLLQHPMLPPPLPCLELLTLDIYGSLLASDLSLSSVGLFNISIC